MTFNVSRLRFQTPTLNPVLVKELRGRMRGPRAFIFLTGVLALLGVVSYGLFQLVTPRYTGFNPGGAAAGAMIGQSVFVSLAFLTLVVVCAIAPSLTAGAISGEHQRKTFDLLMATPLAPFTVLSGKLFAALSYVALILLAAIPMMSLAYVFGGVTPADLIKAFAVMCGFAVTYAVIGLFFSALFRRTGLAVGASYFLLVLCLFGTLFVYAVVGVMRGDQPQNWLLALNPFSAMASALVDGTVTNPNNFSGSAPMLPLLWGLSGGSFDGSAMTQLPLWYYTIGIYSWLTVVLFALATQLIKPVQRFRFKRATWLLVVLFLIGSLFAALAIYGPVAFGLRAAWLWLTTGEREVIVNGNFAMAPRSEWQFTLTGETSGVMEATASAGSQDYQSALRFAHAGEKMEAQWATQPLHVELPEGGAIKVRLTLRIDDHDARRCGKNGDECPLMVIVRYTDRRGQSHEWWQGFHATAQKLQGFAPRCRPCENRPLHVQVPEGKWFTYESPDVFDPSAPQTAPRSLDSISLRSNGINYDVQVAQVSVRLHEGRPPFESVPQRNQYGWSATSLFPWMWSVVNGTGFGIPMPPVPGVRIRAPLIAPMKVAPPLVPPRPPPMPVRIP